MLSNLNEKNILGKIYPSLINEWHTVKNGDLTPFDVSIGSDKKVWWKCTRGHETKMSIYNKVKSKGCSECYKEYQTSFPEQAIYFYLKKVFKKTENRYIFYGQKNKKFEADVFIPEINLIIEYNGAYFHKNRKKSDEEKISFFESNKNDWIIIAEEKEDNEINNDSKVIQHFVRDKRGLDVCIRKIFNYIMDNEKINKNYEKKIKNIKLDLEKDETKIYEMFIHTIKKNSLSKKHPFLVKQWNWGKNGDLKPDFFTIGSSKKIWWKCDKNHEWKTPIYYRIKKNKITSCPYCSNRLVCEDNSLKTKNPDIALEWHPTKNKELSPEKVTYKSAKKVWWLCKICGDEWDSVIKSRTNPKINAGCRKCGNKQKTETRLNNKIKKGGSLQDKFFDIAKQWHPTKNGNLKPRDFTYGSTKKAWWICEKCGKEWECQIKTRTRLDSKRMDICQKCSKKIANKKTINSRIEQMQKEKRTLQDKFPKIAKDWHPVKNENLTPLEVAPNSNKKVWWKCASCNYEWSAFIFQRTREKNKSVCKQCKKS